MDVTANVDVPVSAEKLFEYISDLKNYESWLEMVHSVTPVGQDAASSSDTKTWTVELRARLGPFARSKRLRMVRASCEAPSATPGSRPVPSASAPRKVRVSKP